MRVKVDCYRLGNHSYSSACSTLVSNGAYQFARDVYDKDLEQIIHPESLITQSAQETWQKWKNRMENKTSPMPEQRLSDIQDTVGAVAGASQGDIAAGVSRYSASSTNLYQKGNKLTILPSGGLLLKHPGRLGEVGFRS
jgi:taspase, threonine aspartase, 1